MSVIIGLTGPTGAGKSTAAAAAEGFGLQIIAINWQEPQQKRGPTA